MKKCKIIVNPAAGNGNAQKSVLEIEGFLKKYNISYELEFTQYPRHAEEIAYRAAEEKYDIVAACGGDGTSLEVINGLMRAKKTSNSVPAMSVFPVGRGNDFAFGAGFPASIEKCCRLLTSDSTKFIDIGFVEGGDYPEGRHFGNGIGIGFDTMVGLEAAKMKRIKGFAGYLIGALKTLFFYYKAPSLSIKHGGRETGQKAIQISIMNGKRMGGAFYMAPKADIEDGFFDLCIVSEPSRLKMLGLIVQYLKGTQEKSPFVFTGKASEIYINSLNGELVVHADGETICTAGHQIHAMCLRKQIKVLTSK